MGHLHTENGQFDFTVTAFIIRSRKTGQEVLLHAHRKLHKLLPIGGHIELTETPWAALAHEMREEAGYTLDDLYILQPKNTITKLTNITVQPQPLVIASYDYSPTHNHIDLSYVFVEKRPPSFSPLTGESTDFRWVKRTELEGFTDKDIFLNTRDIYLHALTHCLEDWESLEASAFSTGL